jgi:hypothetical protein
LSQSTPVSEDAMNKPLLSIALAIPSGVWRLALAPHGAP